MTVAIFSDIHGNLPALEAVWKAIQQERPDKIYCLGDLVNFAPWPNEVIEFVRHHHIPTLCGNHDHAIGLSQANFAFSYNNDEERRAGLQAIAATNDILTDDNRDWLKSLPKYLRLKLAGKEVLLTHGSPRSIGEYLMADFPEDTLREMMEDYVIDVLVTGHTHRPYIREIGNRIAINVGSVGKPKDGDVRAAYAVIKACQNTLTTEIKRVDYDISRTQKGIWDSSIPDIFADLLIKA